MLGGKLGNGGVDVGVVVDGFVFVENLVGFSSGDWRFEEVEGLFVGDFGVVVFGEVVVVYIGIEFYFGCVSGLCRCQCLFVCWQYLSVFFDDFRDINSGVFFYLCRYMLWIVGNVG